MALADKNIRYPHGKSRIAYVGETKRGAIRISESAAVRAEKIIIKHAINKLTFFTLSCTRRSKVRTWEKLESALILRFREIHGEVPLLNEQGKKKNWKDEKSYFTQDKLDKTIEYYSEMKID